MKQPRSHPSTIKALVLAGGSSARMGQDKGDIIYHSKPQKYHLATLLTDLGLDTYISIRKDQKTSGNFRYIIDNYENIGPMAGILSAFEQYHTAWLVAGCDYPLLQTRHLEQLLTNRDPRKTATVFMDETNSILLPTLAIYEPAFFPLLQNSVARKDYAIYKLLQKSNINSIKTRERAFKSVDTPAEYTNTKKELHE